MTAATFNKYDLTVTYRRYGIIILGNLMFKAISHECFFHIISTLIHTLGTHITGLTFRDPWNVAKKSKNIYKHNGAYRNKLTEETSCFNRHIYRILKCTFLFIYSRHALQKIKNISF